MEQTIVLFLGILIIGDALQEINIAKHDLVPKHTILKDKEREEVFNKYKITLRQLPRILETDPQIKILGGKPGDVVKKERKSAPAGETIYYRVVIKG